jgi:hypothetical protein
MLIFLLSTIFDNFRISVFGVAIPGRNIYLSRMEIVKFLFFTVPLSKSFSSICCGSAMLFTWMLLMSSSIEGCIAFHRRKYGLSEVPTMAATVLLCLSSFTMIILSVCLFKYKIYRTWLLTTILMFMVQTALVIALIITCGTVLSEQSLFAFTTRNVVPQVELFFVSITFIFVWYKATHLWLCILSLHQSNTTRPKIETIVH